MVSTATCLLKCCVHWARPVFHPVFGLPSLPPVSDPSLDYSLLSRISDRLLSKSCFPSAFSTSLYLGRVERVRETASMTTVLFLSTYHLFIYLCFYFLPVLCSMWNLSPHPCPGIEPMTRNWKRRVLANGPPGKSLFLFTGRFIERIICALSPLPHLFTPQSNNQDFPTNLLGMFLPLNTMWSLLLKLMGAFQF